MSGDLRVFVFCYAAACTKAKNSQGSRQSQCARSVPSAHILHTPNPSQQRPQTILPRTCRLAVVAVLQHEVPHAGCRLLAGVTLLPAGGHEHLQTQRLLINTLISRLVRQLFDWLVCLKGCTHKATNGVEE